MDQLWQHIHGILLQQREVKQILQYRTGVRVDQRHYRRMIIETQGLHYWEDLLIKYGGCSDQTLRIIYLRYDQELDHHLDKTDKYIL